MWPWLSHAASQTLVGGSDSFTSLVKSTGGVPACPVFNRKKEESEASSSVAFSTSPARFCPGRFTAFSTTLCEEPEFPSFEEKYCD